MTVTSEILQARWGRAWFDSLDIRQNLVAGLVVGVIAIPLSIALAVAVGVPPATGLYTAVIAGTVAAIFGGSNFNITGPTAALVPVLAHAALIHGTEALPLLALMSAALLLLMSALRAGRLVQLIPGTVVVGFTAGIALSIAFGQLNAFLALSGTDPTLEHFHDKLVDSFRHLSTIGWAGPLLAIGSLMLLAVWPRLPRVSVVPGPLVAVIAATAVAWGFGIDIPTIGSQYGELPRSFPAPSLAFEYGLVFDLLPLAVAVAILSGVESLLSAVVADGMAGGQARHHSDRELRGQGIGNAVNSLFGGIPSTAAIARTAAGIRSGGTNRLTAVFHALTVLVATLALGGLATHVPLAVLAAILLYIAWNIADVPEVVRLVRRAPREDVVVLLSTMVITLAFDITYAIGFGVLASMVLLLRRMMQVPATRELAPDAEGRIREVTPELADLIKARPDISFFTASGLLSFHSAAMFEYELSGRANKPLILRMKDVHHIDTTGLLRLEGIIEHRQKHGGRTILTAPSPGVKDSLERFGICELLGPGNVFEHTRCAIAAVDSRDSAPRGAPGPDHVLPL